MSDSGSVASSSAHAPATVSAEEEIQSPSQGALLKALLVAIHTALTLFWCIQLRVANASLLVIADYISLATVSANICH